MNKEKFLKLKTEDLPNQCYGLLPSTHEIIIIKKYQNGYFETNEELNYNDIKLIGHIYGDFKAIEYLQEAKKEKGETLRFYITKKNCEIIL